ncbi:MAG: glutamate-1-semialdehyde 2,1-aminomutase [Syntrophomonadaceae bacterium]|nr:glutamate-1-semialdehyde 2,1-aminomutase [Syntrophomonadaceae bacterium]
MGREISDQWYGRAQKVIPGGVNSPVRAFKSVGSTPLFIERAQGSHLYDVDGNEYIDYIGSFGPLILGHSHPQVVEAIAQAAAKGTSYGAPCAAEVELAEMICDAFPAIDKIRMVNSGTEATMSAIRLARAYTGRDLMIKFEGCYHGHADSFLIQAGSGLLTAGHPSSPGVTAAVAEQTIVCRYNDIESVKAAFEQYPHDIAAVIVEPIPANMGLILPIPDFLEELRAITRRFGALLIFDEVITGFRLIYGGYQTISGIEPDLTTLGKVIGGGLPVGAYGGRFDIMSKVAPEGPVYQAGTLSGNPLAMAAGIATLKILQDRDYYDRIEVLTQLLVGRLKTLCEERLNFFAFNEYGSMFTMFCTDEYVWDYQSVMSSDTKIYARFHQEMLQEGVYLPPSQFEVCFISAAHDLIDVERTLQAAKRVMDRW